MALPIQKIVKSSESFERIGEVLAFLFLYPNVIDRGILMQFSLLIIQGIVNDQFFQLEAMKDPIRPVYIVGAIAPSLLSEMALSIVKGLLQQYVQSLLNEGIVNDQFSRIQHLEMDGRADHFVQLINIELPTVDFSKLAALAAEVGERSSCIGAEHVRLACVNLRQACDQMQKQNFLQALNWTKNEFAHTCNKLQVFVQMERRIMRLEAKQKN
ncbi:hypothetical protein CRYUN_Cryun11dG0108300 [Craigia yunnanensis]